MEELARREMEATRSGRGRFGTKHKHYTDRAFLFPFSNSRFLGDISGNSRDKL